MFDLTLLGVLGTRKNTLLYTPTTFLSVQSLPESVSSVFGRRTASCCSGRRVSVVGGPRVPPGQVVVRPCQLAKSVAWLGHRQLAVL